MPSGSAPTWVRNAASSTIENGAATSAPGTAASRQVNASPSGTPGIASWTMIPAVPPMNSDGKMGPPTKPLPWLTAKVSIFAMRVATSRPKPRVPAPASAVLSWSLPLNMVSGRATPTIPKINPPSADLAMTGTFSRTNSRAAAITNPPSSVTTRTANRPSRTPASSCQSWNLYCGTL